MSEHSGSPYRADAPRARPALWVPGLIFAETRRGSAWTTLHTGPEAGRWWVRADLCDWKMEVHLVERRALPEGAARDLRLTLPEELLDPERVPLTHRAAATSPLLAVSPEDRDRLLALGVRVYTVGFERRVDDAFWARAEGGGVPSLVVSAPYHDLLGAALKRRGAEWDDEKEEDEAREALRASHFFDRILRAATGGVIDELRIDQAMTMHSLVEDPARLRGEIALNRATPEKATRRAQVLEAYFRQIEAQAEAQREDAERIVSALAQAAPDAQVIPVPLYGEARRHVAPAFVIRARDLGDYPDSRIEVPGPSGAVKDRLSVPREVAWQVEGVEPWEPTLPAELIQAQRAERDARSRREWALVWRDGCALLAAVALLVLVLALLAR